MGDKFYELNISSAPHSFEEKAFLHKDNLHNEIIVHKAFKKNRKLKQRRIGILGLTLCTLLSSLITFIMWQTEIFQNTLAQYLVLKNGSIRFEMWVNEPVMQTLSFYFFNYTNIEKFEMGVDKKLKFQEVGPYSYLVNTSRVNVTFNPNGTVSYRERKIYTFSQELSNGSAHDILRLPNIPFLSVVNFVKDSNIFLRWAASQLLNSLKAGPFINVTVDQMLWGYDDRLFTLASTVLSLQENELPFKRFGLFASKNGTLPEIITLHTGEKDIHKMGTISRYNGEPALSNWNSESCNRLDNAIMGPVLPPQLKSTEGPSLFFKDACKPWPTVFNKTVHARGVNAYRFLVPETIFARNSENECFCSSDDLDCVPNGVMNTSACSYGAPLVTSLPHFLYGDKSLFTPFEGLSPNATLHDSYLDIEPNLAIVIEAIHRLQINVMVRRPWGMTIFSDAYTDKLILPTAWMQMKLNEFPDDLGNFIRLLTRLAIGTEAFLKYAPIIVLLVCIVFIVKKLFCSSVPCPKDNSCDQSLIETKM